MPDRPNDSHAPWTRRLLGPVAAMVSGALLSLAFPTWNIEFTVWIWMWPLLAVLWFDDPGRRPKRRAFFRGWLAGFAFFLLVLRWLRNIYGGGFWLSLLGWSALSAYLALFFGIWAVFATTVGRLNPTRLLARDDQTPSPMANLGPSMEVLRVAALNACAWAFLEWLRGWFLTGFGWNGVAVGLHENLPMIQITEFTGINGLSLLPIFVSIALFGTAWRIHTRMVRQGRGLGALNLDFLTVVLLLAGVFFFGLRRISALHDAHRPTLDVRAAIVQLDLPQEVKDDPDLVIPHLHEYYDQFTSALEQKQKETEEEVRRLLKDSGKGTITLGRPDLVLLPEAAIGTFLREPATKEFAEAMLAVARPEGTLVSGVDDLIPGEPSEYYNTITVFRPDGSEPDSYRKMNLVPFGEFVPLRSFPPVQWLLGGVIPGDLTRGKETNPIPVKIRGQEIELIPLVCFEDTLGRHSRRFVRDRVPQVIINATNDAWFADPAACLQQAANACFRCIELRRPMFRAANTGLSCAIDETGSLADPGGKPGALQRFVDPATGSPQIRGVFFARTQPSLDQPTTFYARFGEIVPLACGGIALLACLGAAWRRKKALSANKAA